MKKIEINPKTLLKLYEQATPETKKSMEEEFGKEMFIKKSYERITSYEIACEDQKKSPKQLSDFSFLEAEEAEYQYAVHKMTTINDSLNAGYKLEERIYFSVFKKRPAGFGFDHVITDFAGTFTRVGPRLSHAKPEIAEFAGRNFLAIQKIIQSQ